LAVTPHDGTVNEGSSWEQWERLRTSPNPDPTEVLEAVAFFQRYFKAVERGSIQAARAQGRTWSEIGAALGKSRQAVWQTGRANESEIRRQVEEGWSRNAQVRFQIGLDPF
jgi:hypothetical protein